MLSFNQWKYFFFLWVWVWNHGCKARSPEQFGTWMNRLLHVEAKILAFKDYAYVMSCQNENVYIQLLQLKSKLGYFRVSNTKNSYLVWLYSDFVGHFCKDTKSWKIVKKCDFSPWKLAVSVRHQIFRAWYQPCQNHSVWENHLVWKIKRTTLGTEIPSFCMTLQYTMHHHIKN